MKLVLVGFGTRLLLWKYFSRLSSSDCAIDCSSSEEEEEEEEEEEGRKEGTYLLDSCSWTNIS